MAKPNAAPVLQWRVGNRVWSIAVSYDGNLVASGSSDGHVRVWDVHTGVLVLGPLEGHTRWVSCVTWSHENTRLASSSVDRSIRIWDARTGALIGDPLKGHTNSVSSVAFSSDNIRIVSGSYDSTIRLWDVRTGAPIGEPMRGHPAPVLSVAFSPDSSLIASGSHGGAIRIWDGRTGAPMGNWLTGYTLAVCSVAFSPDHTCVVSGSSDNTIRIWNTTTGAPVGKPLSAHTGSVLSVAFSPDSTCIVSGSKDNNVRVWNVRTGATIGEPLQGHNNWVSSVTFSPDSTRIVAGSWDGTICVWETPESTPSFNMVTSSMSVQELLACLVQHGCVDLTSSIKANIMDSEVVACGGFGEVRRLVMNNGTVAAVKSLRFHILLGGSNKAIKRAVREVYIWSRLRHVNVQELLGVVECEGGLGMVSPWMDHGNLQEYIKMNPNVERYPFCIQLASGVSYLHSVDMVHGDLKATNVLVSQDGVLKINDFDYAILFSGGLQFSTTTRPGGGTTLWMAPELFEPEDEGYTEIDSERQETEPKDTRSMQTDIYALGMTMLETLTGTVPYSEYQDDAGIYRAISKKQPPRRPKVLSRLDHQSVPMWELLLKCWDHDPLARPDAPSVLAQLENFAI